MMVTPVARPALPRRPGNVPNDGYFDGRSPGQWLPHLSALNFVLQRPDSQSVTHSLALDAHGKCLGSALLGMEI